MMAENYYHDAAKHKKSPKSHSALEMFLTRTHPKEYDPVSLNGSLTLSKPERGSVVSDPNALGRVGSSVCSGSAVSGCSNTVVTTASSVQTNGEQSSVLPVGPPLAEEELAELAQRARDSVAKKFKDSVNAAAATAKLATCPKFDYHELQLGQELGRGQFGTVSEIRSVFLKSKDNNNNNNEEEERDYFKKHVIRKEGSLGEGDARYAVKLLHPKHTYERTGFYNCYRDMSIEAHFLAALDHRHIVKLRAISSMTAKAEKTSTQFFFITDRLYGTLKEKLSDWKMTHKKFSRRTSSITQKLGGLRAAQLKEKKRDFLESRLRILRDISSAVVYLHQHNVIQRDLKPDNVGFDVRGEIKLFDFGLSTEVAITDHETNTETFNLTGMTGSLRYMAPENYLSQPYNQSIDIYALSIIIWQVITLAHLYPNYQKQMIIELVIQRGIRPDLSPESSKSSSSNTLTDATQKLLKAMWSTNIAARPTAKYVLSKLQRELALVKEAKQLLQFEAEDEQFYQDSDDDEPQALNCNALLLKKHSGERRRGAKKDLLTIIDTLCDDDDAPEKSFVRSSPSA